MKKDNAGGCRRQMGPPALSISAEWITLILILLTTAVFDC